jgi:uncharacterized OB-fold protein
MQNLSKQRPIDPLLFDWPTSAPALKCSICQACGVRAFPVNKSCTACGSEEVAIAELPRTGRLWTYTIQHFMPKAPYCSDETPETFKPFAVGYVELEGALCVETRIPLDSGPSLILDMPMELAFYRHRTEADGIEIINYEFRPQESVTA